MVINNIENIEYLKQLSCVADAIDSLKLKLSNCIVDFTQGIDLCSAVLLCKSIPIIMQYRTLSTVEPRARLKLFKNLHIIHTFDFSEGLPPGKSVGLIACEDFNTSQLLELFDYLDAYQPTLLILGKGKPVPKVAKLYKSKKVIKLENEVIGSILNV